MLAAACTSPPTQVILWFDAERSIRDEIATVRVIVESEGVVRARFERPFAPAQREPKLVLAPVDDDAGRRFTVRAEARGRDASLMARVELRSGYIARTSLYARVIFDAACPAAVLERDPDALGRVRATPSQLQACEDRTPAGPSSAGRDAGTEEDSGGDAAPPERMDASFEAGPIPAATACAPGTIPSDAGCRSSTACDGARDRCEDDCELDGESYRCVCTDGGVPKPEAQGQCWHWQPAVPVEQGDGDVTGSNLAMNPNGTAVAIWFEQHCPLPGCGSDVEVRLWAISLLTHLIGQLEQHGMRAWSAHALTILADAQLRAGAAAQALRVAREAREVANSTDDRTCVGWAMRLQGDAALALGELGQARECLDGSVQLFEALEAPLDVAKGLVSRAALELAESLPDQARKDLQRARELYMASGVEAALDHVSRLEARVTERFEASTERCSRAEPFR